MKTQLTFVAETEYDQLKLKRLMKLDQYRGALINVYELIAKPDQFKSSSRADLAAISDLEIINDLGKDNPEVREAVLMTKKIMQNAIKQLLLDQKLEIE